MYVAYDLKGLQAQIFSVPKLKAICGASSLLAEFDSAAEQRPGNIFAGGGRGVFWIDDKEQRNQLIDALKLAAHHHGFDLRVGVDHSLAGACHHADQLFPYIPPDLDGEPCRLSGRWPVGTKQTKGKNRGVHPVIASRLQAGYNDKLGCDLLSELRNHPDFPAELAPFELRFIRNIASPSSQEEPLEDDPELLQWEQDDLQATANAIGRRSRWAVIALDGNDIGKQFLEFNRQKEKKGLSDQDERQWVQAMSQALVRVTRQAFLDALIVVLQQWIADHQGVPLNCSYIDHYGKFENPTLVLPLRPLILGGDDVTLIIHPAYAMRFVRAMTKRFEANSAAAEIEHSKQSNSTLWPATAGRLTMSAGVLFCKTTFPLHMGIDVAESLLKGAKNKYRDVKSGDFGPSPAAVDWESITESLVESPQERRQRELKFVDQELDDCEVVLFRRPYLLEPLGDLPHLDQVNQLADELHMIPPSVRAQILPRLKGAWSERVAFFASVAKRHPILKKLLWEGSETLGAGWSERKTDASTGEKVKVQRLTGVPDALLLLEEERRLKQEASIA
jgi:hypothetical protein